MVLKVEIVEAAEREGGSGLVVATEKLLTAGIVDSEEMRWAPECGDGVVFECRGESQVVDLIVL